ncbi:MAG: zinc ABC transporter substrate-binding protein, partial [Planctomycetes bacterium]|nr:zinc ABC transporter substrate-binding protein [Planctomycetota bacterium]
MAKLTKIYTRTGDDGKYTFEKLAKDAHAFQATPSDTKAIALADVIISNGMGFDDFLIPILESGGSGDAVKIVVTSDLEFGGIPHDESNHEGENPHLWLNPVFAAGYVVRIRDGLIQADPDHSATYMSNANGYLEQLRALDQEIAQTLQQVPPQRRNLVSYHDAFSHFGERYGW